MNLLLFCEIAENLPMPVFGGQLRIHLESKHHPAVRAASFTAWNLLQAGLKQLNVVPSSVVFSEHGKPVFTDGSLHFSISHSNRLASVLISGAPCAVDLEQVCPDKEARLLHRCLNEDELRAGCNFFETWTKKECIGKLNGRGIGAHPSEMNSLDSTYDGCFFSRTLTDSLGDNYVLTMLCTNRQMPKIQKIEPETLL